MERARLWLDRHCRCGRKVGELTGGAGCHLLGTAVAEASSAAAVGLARSWAGVGRQGEAEPGWRDCSGWASARNEEKGEGRGSWAGGRSGPRIKEGREKIIFPFYFPTNFPKSIFKLFLNSFEH